jgi:peptidoglycan/LPS O-acetylase OafA/YrhL
MSRAGATTPRLPYVDCWRAVAVTLVIISHFGSHMPIVAEQFKHAKLGPISAYGTLGVFIFFFISGFVVSKVCLNELAAERFTVRAFYVRRVFRIAPPLLFYMSVCLVLGFVGIAEFGPQNFLVGSTYVCNNSLAEPECNWLAMHTWSLAYEEQFYLLFPMILLFFHRRIVPNLLGLAAASLLFLIPVLFPIWLGRIGFLVTHGLFAAGYLCARHERRLVGALSRLPLGALVLGVAVSFMHPVVGHVLKLHGLEAASPYFQFVFLVSIPVMVLSSGLVLARLPRTQPMLRPIAYAGRISYSVYLWQEFATSPPFRGLDFVHEALVLAAMCLGCALLFEFVEKRLIAIGRRISDTISDAKQPYALPHAAARAASDAS